MTFKTVFDAGQQGFAAGWFSAFGLIFVVIGAFLVFRPTLMQRLLPAGPQGTARRIFSWVFFIFALLWTAIAFTTTYLQYWMITSALNEGRYSIVEGRVINFVPMPYEGHADESFSVGSQRFTYSDYEVTSGFHNSASHGGPIREGLYVRVTYVGNLILRLEVYEESDSTAGSRRGQPDRK